MRVTPISLRVACWLAALTALLLLLGASSAEAAPGVVAGREATVRSADGLNVRAEPATAAGVLIVADDGDYVHVRDGPKPVGGVEWYEIEYDGVVGWAAGDFLTAPRARGGLSARGDRTGVIADGRAWLPVPYVSQFDGSPYQGSNCGPTSLSMALAAFGKHVSIGELRRAANRMQGTVGWYDAGVGIQVLADLAVRQGLTVRGLYAGGGFDRWSFDEVRQAVRNGHLVIPQVHLATLPGQESSNRAYDHYIVITGYEGKYFRYNDPAFSGGAGHGLLISEELLALAWKRSDYPFAAFSLGPGPGIEPLIAPPAPPRPEEPAAAPAQSAAVPESESVKAVETAPTYWDGLAVPLRRADPPVYQPAPDVGASLATATPAHRASDVPAPAIGVDDPVVVAATPARLPERARREPWELLGVAVAIALFGARRYLVQLSFWSQLRARPLRAYVPRRLTRWVAAATG